GEGRAAQVSEPPPFADQLCAHVAEVSRASLQEDPHTAEVGLVLESMAVRHGAITRSRIKASRRARTVSFGSPEKMWPARGGRRTWSGEGRGGPQPLGRRARWRRPWSPRRSR